MDTADQESLETSVLEDDEITAAVEAIGRRILGIHSQGLW